MTIRTAWIAALTLASLAAHAEVSWPALKDRDLEVRAGSALDFSALIEEGAAGQHGWAVALPGGHIGFDLQRRPRRFLAASLVFNGLNGGLPDKAGSERLATQLRRTGYNLVRLHFIDAQLMAARSRDFDFEPEQLDRLYYLMAKLKEAGIYWMLDGLTSDNAAYGDPRPNRYIKNRSAKLDVLTSAAGFAHWAKLVERLWAAKNPYTGLAPLNDPALLALILVNEGGIGYNATISGGKYPPALAPLFNEWVEARQAERGEGNGVAGSASGTQPAGTLRQTLPDTVRGSSEQDIEFARFVVDLERGAYRKMDAHVRALGFRGLTTAFDNWGFLGADITRTANQLVDMHSYQSLPSNHGQVGSRVEQVSVHANTARYVRELSNARQWGKPFTVSEYGQPFWNRWRHESAALVPAVAAHQGWDAICLFAETPIQFDYGPSPFQRRQAIYPYGTGADPITRAGERLAAMLFLRGDVAPARGRIRVHVDADTVMARSAGWEQVPEGLSRMAFIVGMGLDFGPVPKDEKPGELSVDLTDGRPSWMHRLESGLARVGIGTGSGSSEALRAARLIGADNLSNPAQSLFQSDTGQLLLDAANRRISITTERSVVLVLQGGDARAGVMSVADASTPVLVALSSVDGKPLTQSRRMLLWVLTDAGNSGMRFDDAARTTLRALGSFPPVVQPVSANLSFTSPHAQDLKVWPLSLAGVRRNPVAVEVRAGALAIGLDTGRLGDGPALMFEVATE